MSSYAEVADTIVYSRYGSSDAPKLLVLHGIGSLRQVWAPVVPLLAAAFEVVTVDSPGFGESPEIPSDLACDPAAYAEIMAAFMTRLGWSRAHVLGNSMGGWLALELAKQDRALSVTALAPAGLWRSSAPLNARLPLGIARRLTQRLYAQLGILRFGPLKAAALGALFGKPSQVPLADAILHCRGYADCPGFPRVRSALTGARFVAGTEIEVPVTIAFGSRDPLIRRKQCDLSTLPSQTRYVTAAGWGHVPMYDDPAGVVRLVRETSGI